ncbi:MAG: FMN-binding protein [Deltaproteobacteria bacterium]|nr:FMN-binding protein [Deltaproteobacteria bacterium]
MLPKASRFEVAHVLFSPDQKRLIQELSGIRVSAKAQKIWKAFDSKENFIGWIVVDYVIGKHLLIDYAIAISPEQKVLDVEVLSYRESYGGEIRSKNWRQQFVGKTRESNLTLNKDITNIGGATLSTRHVTEGIKRVLATIHVTQ